MRPIVYTLDPESLNPSINRAHMSTNEKGLSIPWRVIEDYEFVLFTRGSGRYRVLDHTTRYAPGDLILTPPYIRHRYIGSGEPNTHFALHFSPYPGYERDYAANANLRKGYGRIEIRYAGNWTIPQHLPRVPGTIVALMERIADLKGAARPDRLMTAGLRLQSAVLELLAGVVESVTCSSDGGSDVFSRSLKHIDSNFHRPVRVEELAVLEGLSPNYLSTRFKQTYGITISSYLRNCRLRNAKSLLLETNEPVYTIAERCGFPDPFYFSRVFTRREGLSPIRYRAAYRGR